MKFIKVFILVFLIGIQFLHSQELPPISNFTPDDYKAESQNWSISQSQNGFIYVANNKGLLEYNGANWKLYSTPNETIMRSVKVVNDKIFTGFYMDFGYWTKGEFGLLNYTSLVKEHAIPLLEDEQFWSIIELDGWVLFQSFQKIYLYNTTSNKLKVINGEGTITKMFKVEGTIYFQKSNSGIYKIENGTSKLITDAKVFKDNLIILAYKKDNELTFLTASNGFLKLDGTSSFKNKSLLNFLSNKTIYSATQLQNKDFILGTISHGAMYITKEEKIKYELNQSNGLGNNTVLATFEDKANNIWLGLDHGINNVNTNSPIKIFKDASGNLGTVYTSALFKNKLYLGTNQGLFYKDYPSNNSFKLIENTEGQVWSLNKIDNELFCGHNSGTFLIKDSKVTSISKFIGTWGVKKLEDNLLLQGNYDGLYLLKKENNTWSLSHKIKGFNISSRYFEVHNNHQIFINHEYKGVFKLKVDKQFKKVLKIEKDSSVVKGARSSLLNFNDTILYASKNGIYKYINDTKTFSKDTLLSKLINEEDFLSAKIILDQSTNKLFNFSQEYLNSLSPDKFSSNSVLLKKNISNTVIKGAAGFENIERINNSNYLIGALNGYIVIDLNKKENNDSKLTITTVKSNKLNSPSRFLRLNKEIELNSKENNIVFTYSIPSYSKHTKTVYQYKLEGLTNHWSNWSEKPETTFKNLSFGEYSFSVRGKVGDQLILNNLNYNFSIAKPWYLSIVAFITYILAVLLFSFFMHNVYKQYYKRQREQLLIKQQREFELQQLEAEKQLMRIKNEQLKNDVNSKNRELAISTMSIIKKNEFLNKLKTELKKGGEGISIKNIIKIINENINNTDDWQMFKEAFNNADKDFIKKLKEIHPTLTPNDLRLCAYLRLNLSSKEIAPLLNISPRSVEVKRYRLRKKMNLLHDQNLTNYILEI